MVTQKDIYGQTPLHHAVINRNIQAISSLAAKGVRDLFFLNILIYIELAPTKNHAFSFLKNCFKRNKNKKKTKILIKFYISNHFIMVFSNHPQKW